MNGERIIIKLYKTTAKVSGEFILPHLLLIIFLGIENNDEKGRGSETTSIVAKRAKSLKRHFQKGDTFIGTSVTRVH